MTDLTPEKLDEPERHAKNCRRDSNEEVTRNPHVALWEFEVLIAAARERDRLEQACNLARAACKDLGEGVAEAIGYTGAPDGDLLVAECGIMRDRAEAAERDSRVLRKRLEEFRDNLRDGVDIPSDYIKDRLDWLLGEGAQEETEAERDAKALWRLETKVQDLSASDLEHGIHAQFTPTTFLHWIAKAREETDAE